MEFANNTGLYALYVLVPVLLIGALLLRVYRKRTAIRNLPFSAVDLIFKAILVISLCLAMAQPYLKNIKEVSKTVALIDVSDSMDPDVTQSLLNQLKRYSSSSNFISLIPFSENTSPLQLDLDSSPSFKQLKDGWSKLNIGQTNIEKALQSVSSTDASSVILISDGYETQGNASTVTPVLATSGLKLFPLLPEASAQKQKLFKISSLHAPLLAPAQKSVDIRVSVQNTTGVSQSGSLEIKHDDKVILQTKVNLTAGQELLFTATSDPSKEGIKEISAKLAPDDKSLPVDTETAFLSSDTREKILLISGSDEDKRLLEPLLQHQSYQLTSIVATNRLNSFPDLDGHSALLLNNVGLSQLPPQAANTVEKYVADGGGFIMIGGNKSFGLGGYLNTAIEDVLPVQLVPPHAEQKRLNVAVMLVIDKSRSMADNQKLEYSKEAAREVIRNLKDEDYVGVIGFDESPFEVVKMGLVGEMRERAIERVGRLYPDKRTNLFPSMDEGRRKLESVKAGRKHMIILTDGKIPDPSQSYLDMIRQMGQAGITVSTVMIGSEFDFGFLRSMAEYGGGGYYQTDNPSNLPRIFLQDVKVQSGEKTMKEQSEFPVRTGTSDLKSTTITAYPPLKGFVETKQKPKTDLELVTLSDGKAFPLLASWHYRNGKVVAFTSDANGRWSSLWAGWPKFATFWSELIDAVRPEKGKEEENVRFDLRRYVERGSLMLDLSVFSAIKQTNVRAEVLLPGNTKKEVVFQPASKGRFLGEIEKASPGKYEVRLFAGDKKLTPVAFFLSGELFGEKKGQGYNASFLENIAGATGGKINPEPDELTSQSIKKVEKIDLSLYFLLLAAVILCADVLRREVFWR